MSDPQSGHRIYDSDYLADQTNYRNAKIHTKKHQSLNIIFCPKFWVKKIVVEPSSGIHGPEPSASVGS